MELAVKLGRPISLLVIVFVIPFLYVLFSDKYIKGILLTWGLTVLYALAWTRMEGFFKNYKPELSVFFFYRGHAFVMSVVFGWILGCFVSLPAATIHWAIEHFKPSAFSNNLNKLRLIWYAVTVLSLVICLITTFVITEPPCKFSNGYIGCYLVGLGPTVISILSVIFYLLVRILKKISRLKNGKGIYKESDYW